MAIATGGISLPDSKLAHEITELVRDHGARARHGTAPAVSLFQPRLLLGALTGAGRGLKFDAELLYTGAMFHDMGLTHRHSSPADCFEVDGPNARLPARPRDIAAGY
jgi:hypothetical protein